jgi:hypothetical protein
MIKIFQIIVEAIKDEVKEEETPKLREDDQKERSPLLPPNLTFEEEATSLSVSSCRLHLESDQSQIRGNVGASIPSKAS